MSPDDWDPTWVHEHTGQRSMTAWRMVETQHVAATMGLVDSAQEQWLLEEMLEQSKPALPPKAQSHHYLLAAPFRYWPTTASRFRPAHTLGLWYGADDAFCACAEIAYWRQRFLLDSAGLVRQSITTDHSLYAARISGLSIDLTAPPWSQAQAKWQHPSDYTHTNQLGQLIRSQAPQVQWVHYASVRAPGHHCAAVFDVHSLSMVSAEGQYERWHCHTTKDRVTLSNGRERFDF